MGSTNYKDLRVWNDAVAMAVEIYSLTDLMPNHERFGLSSQMRRSAVSIASNIAEGSKRSSARDFHRFVCMAMGSGAELETQIHISFQLYGELRPGLEKTAAKLENIMRMLNGLRTSLRLALSSMNPTNDKLQTTNA